MSLVLDLLPDLRPSDLITDRFAVEAAPRVYNQLTSDVQMLQPIFEYQ
jgi:hypothetical protein